MSLTQSKPIPVDFSLIMGLCICGVIHLLQLIYLYISSDCVLHWM